MAVGVASIAIAQMMGPMSMLDLGPSTSGMQQSVATATTSDYLNFAAGAALGLIQGITPLASFINTSAASTRNPSVQAGWGLGEMAGGFIQAFLGTRGASAGGAGLVPAGGGGATGVASGGIEASVAAAEAQGWALFSSSVKGGGSSATGSSSVFGSRGTQMTSKTIWKGPDGMRIDVENPNPGQRAGQIHFQQGQEKYLYDPASKTWMGAPQSMQNFLDSSSEVQGAIAKGLRFLGE